VSQEALLVQQYARTRNAEAFASLVRQYARLVYGTCLRGLGNEHDAEDVGVPNGTGQTPAYRAARNGHTDCLRICLDVPLDSLMVRARHGNSPATMAAKNGHGECLKLIAGKAPSQNCRPRHRSYSTNSRRRQKRSRPCRAMGTQQPAVVCKPPRRTVASPGP